MASLPRHGSPPGNGGKGVVAGGDGYSQGCGVLDLARAGCAPTAAWHAQIRAVGECARRASSLPTPTHTCLPGWGCQSAPLRGGDQAGGLAANPTGGTRGGWPARHLRTVQRVPLPVTTLDGGGCCFRSPSPWLHQSAPSAAMRGGAAALPAGLPEETHVGARAAAARVAAVASRARGRAGGAGGGAAALGRPPRGSAACGAGSGG